MVKRRPAIWRYRPAQQFPTADGEARRDTSPPSIASGPINDDSPQSGMTACRSRQRKQEPQAPAERANLRRLTHSATKRLLWCLCRRLLKPTRHSERFPFAGRIDPQQISAEQPEHRQPEWHRTPKHKPCWGKEHQKHDWLRPWREAVVQPIPQHPSQWQNDDHRCRRTARGLSPAGRQAQSAIAPLRRARAEFERGLVPQPKRITAKP